MFIGGLAPDAREDEVRALLVELAGGGGGGAAGAAAAAAGAAGGDAEVVSVRLQVSVSGGEERGRKGIGRRGWGLGDGLHQT